MGGSGDGIYKERGIHADRVEGEVLDIEVCREGERKGFLEGIVIEKGGAGAGGGNDQ